MVKIKKSNNNKRVNLYTNPACSEVIFNNEWTKDNNIIDVRPLLKKESNKIKSYIVKLKNKLFKEKEPHYNSTKNNIDNTCNDLEYNNYEDISYDETVIEEINHYEQKQVKEEKQLSKQTIEEIEYLESLIRIRTSELNDARTQAKRVKILDQLFELDKEINMLKGE